MCVCARGVSCEIDFKVPEVILAPAKVETRPPRSFFLFFLFLLRFSLLLLLSSSLTIYTRRWRLCVHL